MHIASYVLMHLLLICIDTFNGCDDGDDKSIETETEGDFM